ncbi:hypothetical protein [Niabella hirudinis]|uniref:hypothetical protein n=1 Tax=Niabella hirudinis TaxID=1285929 RepID=UPI003EBCF42E
MRKLFLPTAAAVLLLSSCVKESGTLSKTAPDAGVATLMAAGGKQKNKVYSGPEVSFKKGKATTLYEVDAMNHPVSLAIYINNAAWNSLDMPAPGGSNNVPANTVILRFHPKVDAHIFNHVELNWNPHGHEPENIYGLPHFDFHFYNTSVAEVEAIPPYEVDPSKFDVLVGEDYLPSHYFNPGGGVPQMGTHWLDATSPELPPQNAIFGQTFIYGTYNGKVTFIEPMITKAFLDDNSGFTRSVPRPAKVAISGYYPKMLRLQKTDDGYLIILENFEYREAS